MLDRCQNKNLINKFYSESLANPKDNIQGLKLQIIHNLLQHC